MSQKTISIDVEPDGSRYKSTTVRSKKVKGKDDIVWNVTLGVLPDTAKVELRFDNSKLVGTYTLTDNATRQISGKIQNKGLKKGDSSSYQVWFVDGHTEYCMEDPELVMDSDTPSIVPKRPRQNKAVKKTATKKHVASKKKAKKR